MSAPPPPVSLSLEALGTALPSASVANRVLEDRLALEPGWILGRTGVRTRRIVADGESTATLATQALQQALDRCGVRPSELGLLIVATTTPEQPVPSTAAFVSEALGTHCAAFDVNAACTGFVYALLTAASMMSCDPAMRYAAVIGAETFSRIVDPADRDTAILFGDGAGAVVLGRSPSVGAILGWNAVSQPAIDILQLRVGGNRFPYAHDNVEHRDRFLTMAGREVMRAAVPLVASSIRELLLELDVDASEIDAFVMHQANARILASVARQVGVAPDRVIDYIEDVGNTSTASIPLALQAALDARRIRPGDQVLISGFGAGFTVANVLVRWGGDEAAAR